MPSNGRIIAYLVERLRVRVVQEDPLVVGLVDAKVAASPDAPSGEAADETPSVLIF